MKIQKNNGEYEEYDRGKLERSILNAGASPEIASKIPDRILPLIGLSTHDLRKRVAEELNRENPALSASYLSTRRLVVKQDENIKPGTAGLSEDLMTGLKTDPGAVLFNRSGRLEVSLQLLHEANAREVHLSKQDIERLKAKDGERVAIRFPV